MTQPQLIVTTGIPASGKTHFIKQLGLLPSRVFCPTDMIRAWSPEALSKAWREEYARFGEMLSSRELDENSVLAWDGLFLNQISRSAIVNIARGAGFSVHAVVFPTDIDTCLKRNAARPPERHTPESKIRALAGVMEMPHTFEGYDALVDVGDPSVYDRAVSLYRSRNLRYTA